MDYRFQSVTHLWLKQRGLSEQYDVISAAGSSLNLLDDNEQRTFILNQIDLAINKHGIERIIILHHEDCAALGNISMNTDEQINYHYKKTAQAEKIILTHYPDVKVEKFFVTLKGDFLCLAGKK
ncbi:hypothetical protein JOC37_002180 [Desulfohalotomaculum tongense]|nr:carbonic anhydrase [Desulforadius tongensis]MBM7855765.1 hypothetical protein [Desulforadius tongensis]